jgi:hypothetical protein
MIIGVLSLGVKWLGLEGDDSSHPFAWVRMSTATPPSFLVLLAESKYITFNYCNMKTPNTGKCF